VSFQPAIPLVILVLLKLCNKSPWVNLSNLERDSGFALTAAYATHDSSSDEEEPGKEQHYKRVRPNIADMENFLVGSSAFPLPLNQSKGTKT
jgi:hypothetical protein